MRRIVLLDIAVCAAIVAGLTAPTHARATGEALTYCDNGGSITVNGSHFTPGVVTVWEGNIVLIDATHEGGDNAVNVTVDSSGSFSTQFPKSDIGPGPYQFAVTQTDFTAIFGPDSPAAIPACTNNGAPTQVVLTGTPPSTPVSHPTIVLIGQLADASGNGVHLTGTQSTPITFTASDHTMATCTVRAPNDSCSVRFALTSPGETITANIPGGTGTFGGDIHLGGVGSPSSVQSTISASPGSIAADGVSTSLVSVQTKDQFGFTETTGGAAVALTLSPANGSLSAVTDNHDGTYTATFTSSTTAGTVRIGGTVNGSAITSAAPVICTQVVSPLLSTIVASPTSIQANGTSTSTITVQIKDLAGVNFTSSAGTVTLSTTLGTLSAVTDNQDGTYTATLASGLAAGTALITGSINNASMSGSAAVAFTPVASAANSTISASPASVPADGTATATVIVQIKDLGNANFPSGGGTVVLSSSLGTLSGVVDNGNGTYTATIASTTAGTAVITATFNGSPVPGSASVTFTPLFTTGCARAGDVNGGLNAKGALQINVEIDCDAADKKHPAPYLHHGHIHVDGLGLKVEAEANSDSPKKGDINSVAYTSNPDGSTTARITGTWNGQPFVLTVTDAGKKAKGQDSFDFFYGGREYGPYFMPHGNVKIDLE